MNKSVKTTLITLAIIALLFLTGALSIATEGCTLPVDLVLFRRACVFGSLGASCGMTLLATLTVGAISILLGIAKRAVLNSQKENPPPLD